MLRLLVALLRLLVIALLVVPLLWLLIALCIAVQPLVVVVSLGVALKALPCAALPGVALGKARLLHSHGYGLPVHHRLLLVAWRRKALVIALFIADVFCHRRCLRLFVFFCGSRGQRFRPFCRPFGRRRKRLLLPRRPFGFAARPAANAGRRRAFLHLWLRIFHLLRRGSGKTFLCGSAFLRDILFLRGVLLLLCGLLRLFHDMLENHLYHACFCGSYGKLYFQGSADLPQICHCFGVK